MIADKPNIKIPIKEFFQIKMLERFKLYLSNIHSNIKNVEEHTFHIHSSSFSRVMYGGLYMY